MLSLGGAAAVAETLFALRSCAPLVQIAIMFLRKATREGKSYTWLACVRCKLSICFFLPDESAPQLVSLEFLPDALASFLQLDDVIVLQNALITIAHLGQQSVPFAEQLEKRNVLPAVHAAMIRHANVREVVDFSIFTMTALCKALATAKLYIRT